MPELMELTVATAAFILGTVWGSFLNVVIYRYPGKRSLGGRSCCLHCAKQLKPHELVPILSFIFLRGKCSHCRREISIQYPLVELGFGLVCLMLAASFLAGWLTVWQVVIDAIMVALLVVLFVIDLKTMILPDFFIVLLGAAVVVSLLLTGHNFLNAALGAVTGAGFLFFLWLVTAKKGIGFGDVKLMIPLGALLGLGGTAVLLLAAFVSGGLVGSWLLLTGKVNMKTAIPFGPFLAGVGILLILVPVLPDYLFQIVW